MQAANVTWNTNLGLVRLLIRTSITLVLVAGLIAATEGVGAETASEQSFGYTEFGPGGDTFKVDPVLVAQALQLSAQQAYTSLWQGEGLVDPRNAVQRLRYDASPSFQQGDGNIGPGATE